LTAPRSQILSSLTPALVTLLVTGGIVLIVLILAGGDLLSLVRLGTRYSQGDPLGTEGYDGQFVYYIARDPRPSEVASLLDVPAYRYQRLLMPLLGRLLSLGNPSILPVVLLLIGVLSQAAGAWAVGELFAGWGISRWYALVYGLWAGCLLAVITDLPEPLAYALTAGGLLALRSGRSVLGWLLLGLALFAKEVTLLFVGAALLEALIARRWKDVLGLSLVAVLPFLVFQAWLWQVFGQPGLGSGGAMSTPFEWIPFMGLLRIGGASLLYLAAMLVVFGPLIVLPTVWGAWKSLIFFFAGNRNMVVLSLFFNSLMIVFLPFSTFRETGGLLRLACGLVLALLLFAARYRQMRILNYSWIWMVLNVFLFKS